MPCPNSWRQERIPPRLSSSKRVVRRMSAVATCAANGWTVSSSRHALVVHPPARKHLERELALTLRREVAAEARVVDRLPDTGDERHEHVLQAGEDDSTSAVLMPWLVVVEEDVVRVVVRLVTRDVLAARARDPVLEMRTEDFVVDGLARLEPGRVAERAGARHLGAEVARNAALLLVVAPRDADDARLERLALGDPPRARAAPRAASRARARSQRSCASRASVASCSARAGAPSGGIFVSWSQPSR